MSDPTLLLETAHNGETVIVEPKVELNVLSNTHLNVALNEGVTKMSGISRSPSVYNSTPLFEPQLQSLSRPPTAFDSKADPAMVPDFSSITQQVDAVAYLESNVFPTLLPALENVLRTVKKRRDMALAATVHHHHHHHHHHSQSHAASPAPDILEEVAQDLMPVQMLAQWLYRMNPRHKRQAASAATNTSNPMTVSNLESPPQTAETTTLQESNSFQVEKSNE